MKDARIPGGLRSPPSVAGQKLLQGVGERASQPVVTCVLNSTVSKQ